MGNPILDNAPGILPGIGITGNIARQVTRVTRTFGTLPTADPRRRRG